MTHDANDRQKPSPRAYTGHLDPITLPEVEVILRMRLRRIHPALIAAQLKHLGYPERPHAYLYACPGVWQKRLERLRRKKQIHAAKLLAEAKAADRA